MKFTVRIDDKAWDRLARKLAALGMEGEPAVVLEALIATTLTREDLIPRTKPADNPITSTTVMLTLGRIQVEEIPDGK